MNQDLERLLEEARARFAKVSEEAALADAKAAFLGKTGALTALLKTLGTLAGAEKAERGRELNQLKQKIEALVKEQGERIRAARLERRLASERLDVSLPGRAASVGGLHPISLTIERIERIFRSIGFDVADGPEIEEDFFNFTALNMPPNHPARSMADTFYIQRPSVAERRPGSAADSDVRLPARQAGDGQSRNGVRGDGGTFTAASSGFAGAVSGAAVSASAAEQSANAPLVLRTHTSPMQVRYARMNQAPIKVIVPGKTYRVDSDATHSPMFHQVEGLWVDEDISFADLKSVYTDFLHQFFERTDIDVRFRPSYFPFTEPSAEIDMRFADGPLKGRWLEVSGSGQVHPNVIRNIGLDPERYIGFAFGSGIERLAMLRHGVDDLRLFYENDLRFLRQFA
ncbi:MAG: phenylalanine--tRNA ligase subunit alpha [Lautropia sp.]|nr:phenylalanine--tRNA ligase subunit alpha [Lautropia sp.]